MFPENTLQQIINDLESNEQIQSSEIGETPFFDFDGMKIFVKNGTPEYAKKIEAIKQWIIIFVTTPKDTYSIYEGTSFGTSYRKLFGQKRLLKNGYAEAELERELREGLLLCPAINQMTSFDINKSGRVLDLYVQVELKNGDLIDVSVEDLFNIKGI